MSITETLTEVIDEVLDEKEKEVIISFLDSADKIDFDDFWRKKNYKIIAEKGLTSYSSYRQYSIKSGYGYDKGFRSVSDTTVYERLKSAMTKLEKSTKLRAICTFSSFDEKKV